MEMVDPTDCNNMSSWTDDQCFVEGAHAFILRVSSVFGLAPLKFRPHRHGYNVSFSVPMCIYSYIMQTAVVIFTMIGIIGVISLIQLDERTTFGLFEVIAFIDIMSNTILSCLAVYGAPGRMKCMIKFMNTVASVDKHLRYKHCSWWERKLCFVSGLFILSYFIIRLEYFISYAMETPYIHRKNVVVINVFGSLVIYVFVIVLMSQLAVTVMMVHSRFKAVKETLSAMSSSIAEKNENMRVVTPDNQTLSDAIQIMSMIHRDLWNVLRSLEKSYGIALFIMLAVTVCHNIVIPFYALAESQKYDSIRPVLFQVIWYSINLLKLLMMVEPHHYITVEVNEIEGLVCRMLVSAPTSGSLTSQLERLALQLMLHPVCFKPKGLVTVDRGFITSVFGTCVTYQVVLFQFQSQQH